MKTKNSLFNYQDSQEIVNRLKSEINCPFVSARISTLGGEENVAIMLLVSKDSKENWPNNIMENSTYKRFSIDNNGTTENFVSDRMKKTRKFTAKSVDDLIIRLNKAMIL